jgi:hypothetical protein
MAIDALQRDVFEREGLKAGNYAFFAEQAENLFMPSVLFALDEYGIPIQTAQRLQRSLLPASSLDEVSARLGRINPWCSTGWRNSPGSVRHAMVRWAL